MRRFFAVLLFSLISTSTYAADTYFDTLDGLKETSPNASPATGDATITVDGNNLSVLVNWSGLIGGNSSAAHIHCCIDPPTAVGVAVGFPGFPASASGTYSHLFDLSDPSIYTASFLNNFGGGTAAGAKAALIGGLNTGTRAYVNIHNSQFPGGEIRGFPSLVPEPATLLLLACGISGLSLVRRRPGVGLQ